MGTGPEAGTRRPADQVVRMTVRSLLRATNPRVRILVGLMLISLFCIQCADSRAIPEPSGRMPLVISGKLLGDNPPSLRQQIDRLARTDHTSLLALCRERCQDYRDYRCTFVKQERIAEKLGNRQVAHVKCRESPFSVAMAWIENAPIGDRILYVDGRYDGQMLVRPANPWLRALAGGQVLRKPDDPTVRRNSLRAVTMFGFRRTLDSLLSHYRLAGEHDELEEEFGGYYDINGRQAVCLIRWLPAKRDYPAWKTVIYIDLEYLVPVRVEARDWDDRLSSVYAYEDIRPNVGLTDGDFLPEANDMSSPR